MSIEAWALFAALEGLFLFGMWALIKHLKRRDATEDT
jgi:hypothetical protein